ncbi:copper amine oxidase N-terminal domain-containing protein [Peptoniphilus sp. oral taxon 386]|uniref:copper amine oxidase N-terminal domain-containing protein n=1 Tax=Peptoniphilus sp. oral taxon 386 TaxID=652713 RepID=UPI0001DA9AA1|nr:copper amine oxidase N-terminal domain-containing protein [Peptoniphilus sp. oral taxon 386]EFI41979.1 copper amine oxidase domain protein [Peptoniphilus sp. oral taxon 386 str. F0131]
MKKIIASALILSLVLIPAVNTHAVEIKNKSSMVMENEERETEQYISYDGEIKSIEKNDNGLSLKTELKNDKGEKIEYIFNVEKDTKIFNDKTLKRIEAKTLKEGDKVTAFHSADIAIAAIYPARIPSEVLVLNADKNNLEKSICKFNKDYVCKDELQITGFKNTEIVWQDGTKATKEDIVDKKVLVFYDKATLSLPAQINPLKIIILEDKAETLYKNEIQVGKNKIGFNSEILEKDGVKLYPLREIFENMGAKIDWNAKEREITIKTKSKDTKIINLKKNTLKINNKEIELVMEYTIENGKIYVPIGMFSTN